MQIIFKLKYNFKKCALKKYRSGQALFEFLFFFPLMIGLYVVTVTIANSINGSINQQKITRGYLYNVIHNDPEYPPKKTMAAISTTNIGLVAVGWTMTPAGQVPVAPCYRLPSLSTKSDQAQNSKNIGECSPGDGSSTGAYVRVKTAYGLCVGNFFTPDNKNWYRRINSSEISGIAEYSSCSNN
jgi:hypothetical protein